MYQIFKKFLIAKGAEFRSGLDSFRSFRVMLQLPINTILKGVI